MIVLLVRCSRSSLSVDVLAVFEDDDADSDDHGLEELLERRSPPPQCPFESPSAARRFGFPAAGRSPLTPDLPPIMSLSFPFGIQFFSRFSIVGIVKVIRCAGAVTWRAPTTVGAHSNMLYMCKQNRKQNCDNRQFVRHRHDIAGSIAARSTIG